MRRLWGSVFFARAICLVASAAAVGCRHRSFLFVVLVAKNDVLWELGRRGCSWPWSTSKLMLSLETEKEDDSDSSDEDVSFADMLIRIAKEKE